MLRALAFAAWALTAREPAEHPTRGGLPLDVWRAQAVADDWYADVIEIATEEVGRPDLAHELWRICRRESRCGQYGTPGIHERDAWVGLRVHSRAVALGWLRPDVCPEHRITTERPARAFATRGAFGQIAAYAVHRLEPFLGLEPGECMAPELLDKAGNAALSAVAAMVEVDPWGRLKYPTCASRLALWAGPGKVATWSPSERRRRLTRQCGPQPGLTPWEQVQDLVWPVVQHWRSWTPPPHPPASPSSRNTPSPSTSRATRTTWTPAG